MVFNRVSDVAAQPVIESVVAAHCALQLRKLADHVGDQIGLGQQCGLISLLCQGVAAKLLADGAGNRPHARDTLALGAELVVINHFVQAVDAGSQRLFTVLVKEEFGIGQPRPHHALVAANDGGGICRADVAHHQKLMRQLASSVEQREVFLIRLHGQDQAFLRHVEKFFFKAADQHVRTFDQGRDFVQQSVVVNRHHATYFCRGSGQLTRNVGLAFGKTGDHGTVFSQCRGVLISVRDHHRRDSGFKAMALRAVARFQAQRLQWNHRRTVQGHQPVRRAHKADAAPAGQHTVAFQLVAHDFRNRQFDNGFLQGFLQAVGQRRTGDHAVVKQRFGFTVHDFFQTGDN